MDNKESRKSSVSPSEQETTISFSRDGKTADVWTSDVTMMTRLDKLCKESPNNYTCIEEAKTLDGLLANKRYTIKNKKLVSFRSSSVKRQMTDEQRAKSAERLRQSRLAKSVH